MTDQYIELDGENLTLDTLNAIIKGDYKVELSSVSKKGIKKSAEIVQEILREKKQVYGITTGFGYLQNIDISNNDTKKLQENLILSHSAGVGPAFEHDIVKGMIALQINKFARGHSGVRLEVVDYLIKMLNSGVVPIVPSQGSLGASGDLAPLAHLSLVLIGKGSAYLNDKIMSGQEALNQIGLKPIQFIAKEGLALLNGTQAMTSSAAISIKRAIYLLKIANIATALSMEVHRGNIDSLHPLLHQARPHIGQSKVAEFISNYLNGSQRIRKLIGQQDSYSLRCVPAVHGAILDTIEYSKKVIEIEMNASTDNPLIFSSDQVFSGGNFHGEPIALILDFLGIALTELGNISERRIERLLNPTLSKLPAFLTPESGLNSGFMLAQYTAVALTSENKQLATPATTDSIPVSANQEDHVSMGMIAANKLRQIITNLQNILAIELLCVAQAIDLADIIDKISPLNKEVYSILREQIPTLKKDRELSPDIELCADLIRKQVF